MLTTQVGRQTWRRCLQVVPGYQHSFSSCGVLVFGCDAQNVCLHQFLSVLKKSEIKAPLGDCRPHWKRSCSLQRGAGACPAHLGPVPPLGPDLHVGPPYASVSDYWTPPKETTPLWEQPQGTAGLGGIVSAAPKPD